MSVLNSEDKRFSLKFYVVVSRIGSESRQYLDVYPNDEWSVF